MTRESAGALMLCVLSSTAWAETRSSENDPRLKKALERNPRADANGDGVLTIQEARAFLRRTQTSRPGRKGAGAPLPPPTIADVHYGPHRLQVFDLWQAKSDKPTPIVLFIHGGGFRGGDKRILAKPFLDECLAGGLSVAAINYRLIPEIKFPVPMDDCARAVQFIRHNAKKWNLDPKRIASTGGSAGGGISLWLAFHDDLADPKSQDPIARESTRLTCVAVSGAQSSYDPRFAEKIGLKGLSRHQSFLPFYGLKQEELDTPKAYRLYDQASPIKHLSKDDPPVLMDYGVANKPVTESTSMGELVHHPKFGLALKEEMDALGIECIVQYPGGATDRRTSKFEFIKQHFGRAGKKDQ
ncbi:MAG: alpha/beta hydrolase [Phycisphaerae bacterium]|nr:alpha/beta hydrolase [Phycisphaerae bacterium]